ncbi:MAG: D-alanyl-D-alanine carboxypeptidase [Clostridia bacterium]|nr:D-alanyl-D-alanine carboxypeptidase [Clostridia bacterium]
MRKILASLLAVMLIFSVIEANAEGLELNGKSFILIECTTGKVLYEQNADERLAPASVTKVMTMLLVMEAIDRGEITYDTVVTASERAKSIGGSTIFLDTGEEMTIDDLLKGIAVASGNDACVAVAEHLSGSVEQFVAVMNNRAKELGMVNTNFVTCNGLDDDNHYSSARDIAIMSRELLKHEDIFRYTTIWMDSLRGGRFQLANTNKLIRYYSGANGLKTGSTSKAKNCISATAKRDGMQLCAVVLGSDTSQLRFNAASTLLNYGFANFAVKGTEGGEIMGEVLIKKGQSGKVRGVLESDCVTVTKKSEADSITKEINMYESVNAPVKKGDKLGEIVIKTNDGNVVKKNIVAENNVDKITFGKMYMKILKTWTT